MTVAACAEIYRQWQSLRAEELQKSLTAQRLAIQAKTLIPALKQIMARAEDDESWLTVRPPVSPLSPVDVKSLFAGLDSTGFAMKMAA